LIIKRAYFLKFDVCYERKIFENWNFENRNFWKFSTHLFRFLHSKLRLFDVKKFSRLTFFRSDSSLTEKSREVSDHLVKKKNLRSEIKSSSVKSLILSSMKAMRKSDECTDSWKIDSLNIDFMLMRWWILIFSWYSTSVISSSLTRRCVDAMTTKSSKASNNV
jgi:hypothetical protein